MTDVANALTRELPPLQRALMRATRTTHANRELSDAQIAVLRVLRAEGPYTTGDLAGTLGLAPSTISNLSKQMLAAGLIHRLADATDGRRSALEITQTARELLAEYDARSVAAVDHALQRLDADELDALTAALPAMRHLRTILTQTAP